MAFKKSQSPEVLMNLVCYFVFEGSFQDFSLRVRKVFGPQFDDRVIMNEVTVIVKTGVSMNADEVQILYNFLWQFLDSIPKLKKHYFGDNASQAKIMNYKDKKD